MDGVDARGRNIDHVCAMMVGASGTRVDVTVEREGYGLITCSMYRLAPAGSSGSGGGGMTGALQEMGRGRGGERGEGGREGRRGGLSVVNGTWGSITVVVVKGMLSDAEVVKSATLHPNGRFPEFGHHEGKSGGGRGVYQLPRGRDVCFAVLEGAAATLRGLESVKAVLVPRCEAPQQPSLWCLL